MDCTLVPGEKPKRMEKWNDERLQSVKNRMEFLMMSRTIARQPGLDFSSQYADNFYDYLENVERRPGGVLKD